MNRTKPSHLVFAGLLLTSPLCLTAADNPAVQLPKVVVTETSLEKAEHWRYTQIPGYEILSQARDAKVQQLVQELELLPAITKTIWPGPAAIQRSPTTIILCGADKTFGGFIPASVRQGINPALIDRLFLKNESEEVVVFDSEKMGDDGRFKEMLRDYARRSFMAIKPAAPDWFVTGMVEIIADANYEVANGQLKVQYAALDKPPRGVSAETVTGPDGSFDPDMLGAVPPPATLYETEKPSPAVREIIRGSLDNRGSDDELALDPVATEHKISHQQFNSYFRLKPHHSDLVDILRNKPTLSPDEYRMTCWAFVHLGAFGEQRRYGAAFGKFLVLSQKNPGGDINAMLRESFGKVAGDLEIIVSEYCDSASSTGVIKTIPYPAPSPAVITDADPTLVGRIKADAYRLAGHPAEADAEIAKARRLTHEMPAEPR